MYGWNDELFQDEVPRAEVADGLDNGENSTGVVTLPTPFAESLVVTLPV